MEDKVTDDSLVIVGGKRRGRPRVEEPLTQLAVRIQPKYLDRLIRLANVKEMSVSALVRQLLVMQLSGPSR